MATAPNKVVAFTGEDDRYQSVETYAARAVEASGGELILYDIDAGAQLQAPLPTDWSAEGTQEQFETGRLTSAMLEGVGRHQLAEKLRKYEQKGIDAFAWLPDTPSVDALAHYAEVQGADLIVVPAHSDHRTLMDHIRGRDTSDMPERTDLAVAVIGPDGTALE